MGVMRCVLALFLFAANAIAEPEDPKLSVARQKFEDALHLEDAKRYPEALAEFRQVAEVRTTPQVRYHIAFCLRRLGRLVEAARELENARVEAIALGQTAEPLAIRAEQDRNDLYSSMPRLSVKRTDGTRPPEIVLDGATTSLGEDPLLVDPGRHRVVVPRSSGAPFEKEIEVEERHPAMVAEILVGEPARGFKLSTPTIVAGSVTLLTLSAAAITGLAQLSVAGKLDSQCGAQRDMCPPGTAGDIATAQTLTTTSNVLLVVSGVGLLATGVLFFATSLGPRKVAVSPLGFVTMRF